MKMNSWNLYVIHWFFLLRTNEPDSPENCLYLQFLMILNTESLTICLLIFAREVVSIFYLFDIWLCFVFFSIFFSSSSISTFFLTFHNVVRVTSSTQTSIMLHSDTDNNTQSFHLSLNIGKKVNNKQKTIIFLSCFSLIFPLFPD